MIATIQLQPGQILARYRIIRRIGTGGMGTVYEAFHPILKKRFAIKTLLESAAHIPEARTRFLREAEAAARISHPNVVQVTDVGTDGDIPYMVMEYLEGKTLAELLATCGHLDIAEALDILLPVVSAVAAGHALGVIHRDLKPENIFLARGSRGEISPKVLDFGVSKLTDDGPSTLLTGPQTMLGTAAYMSPEQARGAHEVDHLSDQYAFGLILYETISGKRAHPGSNSLETIHNIFNLTIVRLRHLRPDCPQALEDVVMRMLSPDPEYRFHSLFEVGSALLGLASEKTRRVMEETFHKPTGPAMLLGQRRRSELTTEPVTVKSRHRGWVLAGMIVAIALLTSLFWAWPRPKRPGLSPTETNQSRNVGAADELPTTTRIPETTVTPAPEPSPPKTSGQASRRKAARAKATAVPRTGKAEENVFDRSVKAPMRPRRGANDAWIIE